MRHTAHFGQESVGEHGDVRLVQTRGGKYVQHAFGRDRTGDDLAHGKVQLFLGACLSSRLFRQRRPHRLEESDVVSDACGLRMRHGQREGL